MSIKSDEKIIVALDIGTSKTAAIIGRVVDENIEVLGIGTRPCEGLKKGVVVNIEATVDSIHGAVEEAELTADIKISTVYVGVSGSHIRSFSCEGMAPISNSEVSEADIERAIETAKAMQLPADQQVLHVLSKDFSIDGQSGIKDPVGMSGYRLQANVHMVTGEVHPIKNITKCVQRCGLKISEIILEQLASGKAVLDSDENELGVCLLDIGGGTTDIVVFRNGAVAHTAVIPVAGDHVTNDIAVTLRTPTKNAEEIKLKYGCALKQFTREDETIEVPSMADRPSKPFRRCLLAEVIQPRYEELFNLVRKELRDKALEDLIVSGFVLTGGSSKMEGVSELAENVFNAPVRIGKPSANIIGLTDIVSNPIYATGIGLLCFASEKSFISERNKDLQLNVDLTWRKFKQWLQSHF